MNSTIIIPRVQSYLASHHYWSWLTATSSLISIFHIVSRLSHIFRHPFPRGLPFSPIFLLNISALLTYIFESLSSHFWIKGWIDLGKQICRPHRSLWQLFYSFILLLQQESIQQQYLHDWVWRFSNKIVFIKASSRLDLYQGPQIADCGSIYLPNYFWSLGFKIHTQANNFSNGCLQARPLSSPPEWFTYPQAQPSHLDRSGPLERNIPNRRR